MHCVIALSTHQVFSWTIWFVGLKKKSPNLKQNAVPPSPDRAQENRTGTNLIKAVGTATKKQIDLLLPLRILKSQHGALLEEIVAGVEMPPPEVTTPRLSRGITKNDKNVLFKLRTLEALYSLFERL